MPATVVTFRSELKSKIADFLADSHMSCVQTEESLVALVVALADHREEGIALFPQVLICDDLDVVLRNVQGSNRITIGSGSRTAETVLHALKKCAPLANSGWAIWVERGTDHFDFGVFREPPTPTALDLRTTLLDTAPGQLHALLAAQYAPGTVELISVGNSGLRIYLSGVRPELVPPEDAQGQVAKWFAEDIEDGHLRGACTSFATTVLHDLLRKGHGTLIAVAPSGRRLPARILSDAVVLPEPADLSALVDVHSNAPSSLALAELLAYVSLLGGMLSSDGITVLDSCGRVLAFNWFIRTDTKSLTPREQVGGARHRAFAALKVLVDKGTLLGAFIRSSNGTDRAYPENANE